MRHALLFLLLLLAVGCNDGPNRQEVDNLYSSLELARARILALETGSPPKDTLWSDVAALRAEVAALAAENQALRARSQSPHLVNASTGEDLGSWHGGLTSFSPRYNAPVNWAVVTLPIYHSTDCSGDAVVLAGVDAMVPGTVIFDKNGGAIRYDGVILASGASRRVGDVCSEIGGFSDESLRPAGTLLNDHAAPPELRTLTVELR